MSELDPMSGLVRQFASMRRDREAAGAAIWKRAAENVSGALTEARQENEFLRTLVRALAELCLEKGLITEAELQARIAKIDAADAARATAAPQRRRPSK